MTKQKEHVLHIDKNGIVQFEKPFLLSPAAETNTIEQVGMVAFSV